MSPKLPAWIAPVTALMLVLVLLLALLRPAAGPNLQTEGLLGQKAPSFALTDLQGQQHQLSDYQGKTVLLNFWATWCQPCKNELPLLQKAQQQYKGQLVILGILFNETDNDKAAQFVQQRSISYPQLKNSSSDVNIAYGITGIPASFFIDSAGRVQQVIKGELQAEQLQIVLKNLGLQQTGITTK